MAAGAHACRKAYDPTVHVMVYYLLNFDGSFIRVVKEVILPALVYFGRRRVFSVHSCASLLHVRRMTDWDIGHQPQLLFHHA